MSVWILGAWVPVVRWELIHKHLSPSSLSSRTLKVTNAGNERHSPSLCSSELLRGVTKQNFQIDHKPNIFSEHAQNIRGYFFTSLVCFVSNPEATS